jgi:glycine C-acetyltransferase/8-amino-7-oxononanoate synthase
MRMVEGAQGPRVRIDGSEVVLLCSNNYLGLAEHPGVRSAGARAYGDWGAGSGASRLVSGNMAAHESLEQRLAGFHEQQAALLFGSGYLANTGVVAALAQRGEIVYSDALNHASIVDGCRLAGAAIFVFRHRDSEHLRWALERAPAAPALIVTDGLFSMNGDIAPVARLTELAREHGARLMVDEAHAVGTYGPGGRGVAAAAGVADEIDVLTGTLGKALGGYGAYAAVDGPLRELLVNSARPLIFSTGLPPAVAAAAEAALDVIEAEPERIARLQSNASLLREGLRREGLSIPDTDTQIIPVMLEDPARALEASARAFDEGVYAQAIRPPTVPEGTSRLRMTVMASHGPDELRQAAGVIGEAVRGVAAGGPPPIDVPEPEGELEVFRAERADDRPRPQPGRTLGAGHGG